ncbi:MAG TPA: hypothetical protein VJ930_04450 [Acidimicrobiia bacterium]|nr:hypothetical protein [Acidimicrobiia bacterium]
MREALWVCGLDENQIVVEAKDMRPGAVVTIRRATSLLELPGLRQPPPPGTPLTWIDARDLDRLRDADREPR